MKKVFFLLTFIMVMGALSLICLPGHLAAAPGWIPGGDAKQSSTMTQARTLAANTPPAAAQTKTAVAPKALADSAVKKGGILKLVNTKVPVCFGYPPNISATDGEYVPPFFNRLIRLDDGNVLNPELATSWEAAADGKTITFHLRKGVKFHDGTDFNAEAVKFNIDACIPPNPRILAEINAVEVVDPYTVRLKITGYSNSLLYQLATSYAAYLCSPTAVQKNGKDWAMTHPVGTGPFVFKDYQLNTKMVFVRNENYWDKPLPYLDGIQIDIVADAMTQLTLMKSGQANAVFNVDDAIANQLKTSGMNLLVGPGANQFLAFDTKNPDSPFANPKVRLAVEYAIDKEGICSGPGHNLYFPIYQVLLSNSSAYNKTLPDRKYNPAKAKQLLAEAGYPNGFEFTCTYQDTSWIPGITAVKNNLAQVGIKMNLNIVNRAAISMIHNKQEKLDKVAACQVYLSNYSSTVYYFNYFWRSSFPQYKFVDRPAGIDKLIDQADSARSNDAIAKTCQEISKLLYDNCTLVPLWQTPRVLVNDHVIKNAGYFINGDVNNNKFGFTTWLSK